MCPQCAVTELSSAIHSQAALTRVEVLFHSVSSAVCVRSGVCCWEIKLLSARSECVCGMMMFCVFTEA